MSFRIDPLDPAIPVTAIAVLLLLELTPLDAWITSFFYEPDLAAFPLRHAFALETVLHDWSRSAAQLILLGMLAIFVLTFINKKVRPTAVSLGSWWSR